MKKVLHFFPFAVAVLVALLIFHQWFLPGMLTGGDLPYYFPQFMREASFFSSWGMQNMGMGSSLLPTLWLQLYTSATLKIFSFLSWDMYVRIAWLFPYLIFSTVSSYALSRYYLKIGFFNVLTPLLFVCNTYALLLVGGGQMGIALSYAIAPLGILAFEYFLSRLTAKTAALLSLTFSLIFLLDIRIAYVLLLALGIRFLLELLSFTKAKAKKYLLFLPLSGLFVVGLHAFWLLPTILSHGSALRQFGDIYTTSGAVTFFSFAKFEDAFGLLHPNWPENVFGLTHFMRPEFLLLPILSYGSLLLIGKVDQKEKLYVLFFALTGLIGIFLAKGANDPFGGIYLWLFNHVPGFIMFRDPTKWYVLIVLSYSLLIPFTVKKIYSWFEKKKFLRNGNLFNFQNLFVVGVVCYLLFLIRPAVMWQLGGTFKQRSIPQEYTKFEKFMSLQSNFSRTLWVPSVDRFGFMSYQHPAVSAKDFYHVASVSGVLISLQKNTAEKELQNAAVGYIVVPSDSEGEIFLKDRKYDNAAYLATVKSMQHIPWLTEMSGFGKLHVFAVHSPKDHFWLTGQGSISYQFINPTTYTLKVQNVTKGEQLIFAENYDSFWHLQMGKLQEKSQIYGGMLNSFALPTSGSYTVTVFYVLQSWIYVGLLVSAITFLVVVFFLFYKK